MRYLKTIVLITFLFINPKSNAYAHFPLKLGVGFGIYTALLTLMLSPKPTKEELESAQKQAADSNYPFSTFSFRIKHYFPYALLGAANGTILGYLAYLIAKKIERKETVKKERLDDSVNNERPIPKDPKEIKNRIKQIRHHRIVSYADDLFSKKNKIYKQGIIDVADVNFKSNQPVRELYDEIDVLRDSLKNMKFNLEERKGKENKELIDSINETDHKLKSINAFIRDNKLYKYRDNDDEDTQSNSSIIDN